MARILIVDDAVFMRKMLSDILVKDGHEIVGQAENALEAVNLYKKLKPDIVTMDIIMTECDGVDSMKAVKQIVEEYPNAKILMVSAMGQQEVVVEAIRAGARDFIVKPFEPSNVASTVKRLMKS